MGLGWALLKGVACPSRGVDIVLSEEGTGVEIDGSVVVEINCHFGEFVLLGSRTNDVVVNQFLEFLRAKSWLELKRSTEEGLSDGKGSECWVSCSHCD